MTSDEIKALIDAMGASDLVEMEVSRDGWTLRLVRHAPFGPPTAAAAGPCRAPPVQATDGPARPNPARSGQPAGLDVVRAPLAGLVHLSPAPDAPPFVGVGQAIEAGALLCTVEAMKMFNEVRAERGGTVEAVLVGAGDEVAAGQPLVRIG